MADANAPQTTDDEFAAALERDLLEIDRLRTLTNEQLVEEILNLLPFTHMDLVIEEACTRLDPDWAVREKPLTAEQAAMLQRVHEKGMARIQEILGK